MNQYKHLLCLDLSNYGSALAALNQFANGESVLDFEISPVGTEAQLLLLFQDKASLQIVLAESKSYFGQHILQSCAIEDINENLLNVYLGQNKSSVNEHLCVFEGPFLSQAFKAAQEILSTKVNLVDFRVVRTSPKNVILVASSADLKTLSELDFSGLKKTLIPNTNSVLKSYYNL